MVLMTTTALPSQPSRSRPLHRPLRVSQVRVSQASRGIRDGLPRLGASDAEALSGLTTQLRGLFQERELTAGEILLRSGQYEASALGEYIPEVAFDPIAVVLRACATRNRSQRWSLWTTAVRAALRAASPDGPIALCALDRTCSDLQVAPQKNPHHDAADHQTQVRAQELGLLHGETGRARYRASRFTELTATSYPQASAAVLQIANDWHYWLWSFDDRTDIRGGDLAVDLPRHERVVSSLLELLAGRELSLTPEAADPNVRYLALILAELQAVAPAACCDRFRHAVHEYLVRGSLAGARNWAADHTPQPETFLGQRIHEGAYDTVLPFIELAVGSELDDDTVNSAAARRAALLANQIVVVSNDIFSYEKEVLREGNPNNLVHAVMVHERRDLHSAYLHVVALVEEWTSELQTLMAQADADLRRYISGNYMWIAASYHWHFATGRYASPTSPFAELRRP